MSAAFPTIEELRTRIAADPAYIAALARETVDHLDGLGRTLNAVAHVAADDALARAKALAAQADKSPNLFGIPLAHKDLYMRAGWPCEGGSKTLKGHRADQTAYAIARLDQAGAIDCGRLTSVEFGLGPTGHNSYAGTPTNPWNPEYICGGSSSGSGAAVAAGIVAAALGTDTGGSVRLPAAACGLVGIKPTHGLVSRAGVIALSPTLDTVGPLTRTVRDGALVLQAIAGADANDPISISVPGMDLMRDIERGMNGLRIGWPKNHFFDNTDADVADGIDAVYRLSGKLGATCVDVTVPGIENANASNLLISAVEAAALHERTVLERHGDFEAQSLVRILTGAFIPAREYHNALAGRAVLAKAVLATTFAHVDVVMTPLWPYPIPTLAGSDLGANPEAAGMVFRAGHSSRPVNYLGFPAVTLPTGFDRNGLPMSVQLIGAPFSEALLLRAARSLERELNFWQSTPKLSVAR